jgi:hypothetical protein
MTRRTVAISLLIVGYLLVSCDESIAPPAEPQQPGWLTMRLSAPRQGVEALLFRITGGPIDSVVPHEHTLFDNSEMLDDWRALLVGSMVSGELARIWVPDPSLFREYSIVVEQAVVNEGFAQQPASGYALTVDAPSTR